jgi:LysR family glycine cleavage system transcriptional activator
MHLRRRHLPSLAELIAFECCARHNSFTRAAEELTLTQGAISRQIRSLEETIGADLFVRVRRSVVLTDAGRVYLTEIRRILAELSAVTERVAVFGAQHVINLAVLPTFATRWLMSRLPEFLAQHPGVTVNFFVRLAPFSFDAEPFDAAIHFGDGAWPGASAHYLCKEEIVPVASPEAAARFRITCPAEVARATLLHQTTRPDAWPEWFIAQGLPPSSGFRGPRFEQFGMIVEAALAGLGVALMPRFLVQAELASGRLIALDSRPVVSRNAYWFVIPERKAADPLVAAFLTWIVQETARSRSAAPAEPAAGSPQVGQ